MSKPIISINNVTYRYPGGDGAALRDFSLDVEEGEFLLVAGVSGAGKSTLLRLLNGLVPHFYGGEVAGSVMVAGKDPVKLGPGEMSEVVGLVFQDPEAQMVAERVEDEVAFGMENAGLPLALMRKRVEESLHALSIEHLRGRRVSTLSGGERQRVAIASVLTMQPRVLVLDEPTSQLDPQSAEEVLDSVVRLNKDLGLTVIMSEHRLERVVQHVDRILYMAPGGETVLGEPREVLSQIPIAPPLVQVGKLLGWSPLPLSIKEARRFLVGVGDRGSVITNYELRITNCGLPEGEQGMINHAPTERSTDPRPLAPDPQSKIENVWFGYGGREVLRDFSMELRAGEITALMGRNGVGKTTILRLILGLLKPAKGKVVTEGLDTRHTPLEEMSRVVGYVPQQPDVLLFADTVSGEIDFTRRAHRLPPDGAALLENLGLTRYREHDPRDLSVGERQRVALAAVLAGEPRMLVLDEPTRGLDYLQKEALAEILRDLRDKGRTIVLATHDVELAAQIADRVVLLGDGEIIADGPAREVMSGTLAFSTQVSKLFRDPRFVTVGDVDAIHRRDAESAEVFGVTHDA
ncbi:MAG TPA: ATP-binding cassette domain-containing protein [Chloroflexia bacterium]|nr:ATP-binding cassette domain-containing protein [Chloroflexia bacterium]